MKEIKALIDGFRNFKEEYIEDELGRYRQLAEYGPHSKILMIACCDSRADPAIITNSQAGDLMVIRNIANLVPPYDPNSNFQETQAALEFAVSYLAVEHVVVMGHSRCGGIRSLLTRLIDDADAMLPLEKWTAVAEPAAKHVLKNLAGANLDDQTCACSREALTASLANLRSYPWLLEREQKQKLQVHGWYFNLADGDLQAYDEVNKKFTSLF
ncbi:carbonic anhydrase [Oceanicoccus sp. KOV_DT_Chl]|uniref:carbonic anhydrase n=1 Tax=Oceanicoccus sp. KOV_DT_Chl TaxID=1904639 RepID=UPI000C7CE9A1|nr:carbonic anhydrase [Oceanicoccus sp. KOV_DT_Chl]